jgi:hypothetical protein
MVENPFVGTWAYRSLYNDPDLHKSFNDLQLGYGLIVIQDGPEMLLTGTIGYAADNWSLNLRGSRSYGSPAQVRFQGKGVVSGAEWIYDYIGWLVPAWPSSTDVLDRPAIVGSVTRTIPHPASVGGISPAGVVGSFYAVKVD